MSGEVILFDEGILIPDLGNYIYVNRWWYRLLYLDSQPLFYYLNGKDPIEILKSIVPEGLVVI